MKKIYFVLVIVFPLLGFCQVQLGTDVSGSVYGELYGISVSLSADGSRLAVGSPNAEGVNVYSGKIDFFEYSGGNWVATTNSIVGVSAYDHYGAEVYLSDNGNRIGFGSGDGNAFMYELVGDNWVMLGQVLGMDNTMTMSGNGERLAVVYNEQVTVYELVANVWTMVGQSIQPVGAHFKFGQDIKLSADGTVLAVSTIINVGGFNYSGSVAVYQLTNNSWVQLGSTISGSFFNFGEIIDLSSDGTVLAVAGTNTNVVEVYKYDGTDWNLVNSPITLTGSASFGSALALNNDGSLLAVSEEITSKVFLYQNISNTWTQVGNTIEGSPFDTFGHGLSMADDLPVIAAGAPYLLGFNQGYGYVGIYDFTTVLTVDNFSLVGLDLFPNPVTNNFVISTSVPIEKVTIYDCLGNRVAFFKEQKNYNVSFLNRGVYIVNVENVHGQVTNKKISIE